MKLLLQNVVKGGEETSRECPNCHSKRNWKDGIRETEFGSVQRFLCRDCGHRFTDKSNIELALSNSRQLGASMKAKKLDSQGETKTVCAGENTADLKGTLIQFAFYCKKEGMRESTIKTFNRTLARLAKVANINDTENIKEAIAAANVVENTKVAYCIAYMAYLKFIGKTWKTPKYTYQQKLPEFLPTEEEIDQLIAGSGKKTRSSTSIDKRNWHENRKMPKPEMDVH